MPLFSIIVPVYKVEDYLKSCVESICSQSFTDFELILIDDGSPDRCGHMCDEYATMDARVQVIHKKNGGVSSARNYGINAATGKWIWFVDSDDYIELFSLEQFAQATKLEPADLYVFNCTGVREVFTGTIEDFLRKYYFTYVLGFGPWNKIYKTEIIKKNKLLFDTQETIGEDLLFNLQYYKALYGRGEGKVFFLGRDYYHYVDRVGSAMNTQSKGRFQQQMRLFEKIRGFFSGSVNPDTVSYFFLLHLISGINQAALGGLTINDFQSQMLKYEYNKEIENTKAVLSLFFTNEHASFVGKARIRLFLILLERGKYKAAGRLMGLRG